MKKNFSKKAIIVILCISLVSALLFAFVSCKDKKDSKRFRPEITKNETPLELKGTFVSNEFEQYVSGTTNTYRIKFVFNKDSNSTLKYNREKGTVEYTYEIKKKDKWETAEYFYKYDKNGNMLNNQFEKTRKDTYIVEYAMNISSNKQPWYVNNMYFKNGFFDQSIYGGEAIYSVSQFEDGTITFKNSQNKDFTLTKVN